MKGFLTSTYQIKILRRKISYDKAGKGHIDKYIRFVLNVIPYSDIQKRNYVEIWKFNAKMSNIF